MAITRDHHHQPQQQQQQLLITIPSYFQCPISHDLMKSPVSLSTGITYDRSSIQTWLDTGHSTCPATMLPLSSPSFVPNLTLHRLIHLWSLSNPTTTTTTTPTTPILTSTNLPSILNLAKNCGEIRRKLAHSDQFAISLAGFIHKFNPIHHQIHDLEIVMIVLDSIISEFHIFIEKTHGMIFDAGQDSNSLNLFTLVLRQGSAESKIATTRVLEKIAIDEKTKRTMIETPGLLTGLYNLFDSESDSGAGIEAGLSAATAIAISKSAKLELLRLGTVRTAGRILYGSGGGGGEWSNAVIEKVMEVLEVVATCSEGRSAIVDDEKCVGEIVGKLMMMKKKGAEKGMVHGVTVLWCVCYLFKDEKAKAIVREVNGLSKCLLLLQSNVNGIVKQMCSDLVKVLRVNHHNHNTNNNYDYNSCLVSYDTKTTHIMPY